MPALDELRERLVNKVVADQVFALRQAKPEV